MKLKVLRNSIVDMIAYKNGGTNFVPPFSIGSKRDIRLIY